VEKYPNTPHCGISLTVLETEPASPARFHTILQKLCMCDRLKIWDQAAEIAPAKSCRVGKKYLSKLYVLEKSTYKFKIVIFPISNCSFLCGLDRLA
jgi:hypothetical protein